MTNVHDLEHEIDKAHERFFAAAEGFDDTTLETQPVCGVWSARDVAGHLADWHNEILDSLELILAGAEPKRPVRDVDSFNHDRAALRGIQSWDEASGDLSLAWQRVLESLESLDEADLQRLGPLPTGTVDRLGGFFRRIVRHTRTHSADVEEFRLRMLGVRDRPE